MLSALHNDQMSIVRVADYLVCYRHLAKPLVTLMAQAYAEERPSSSLSEKRLMYFYVAHEAIFRSKEGVGSCATSSALASSGFEYVKAFGDRFNEWVDIFANGTGNEEAAPLDALLKLLQLWEDEQIFAHSFTDLLKSQLRPKLDLAL